MPSGLIAALAAPIRDVAATVGPGWSEQGDPVASLAEVREMLAGVAAATRVRLGQDRRRLVGRGRRRRRRVHVRNGRRGRQGCRCGSTNCVRAQSMRRMRWRAPTLDCVTSSIASRRVRQPSRRDSTSREPSTSYGRRRDAHCVRRRPSSTSCARSWPDTPPASRRSGTGRCFCRRTAAPAGFAPPAGLGAPSRLRCTRWRIEWPRPRAGRTRRASAARSRSVRRRRRRRPSGRQHRRRLRTRWQPMPFGTR